jgi:hypothetical protein
MFKEDSITGRRGKRVVRRLNLKIPDIKIDNLLIRIFEMQYFLNRLEKLPQGIWKFESK